MATQLTHEQYIEKVSKIHNFRYDYSKTVYTNSKNKIKIICKEHGEFVLVASKHTQGRGCPHCKNKEMEKSRRLGHDNFVERAKEIHGDQFDYSVDEYSRFDKKIKIRCREHDEVFEMLPHNHLNGQVGCSVCKNEKINQSFHDKKENHKKEYIKTIEENIPDNIKFIRLDYEDFHKSTVHLYCTNHNKEYSKRLDTLLSRMFFGCSECLKEDRRKRYAHTTEEFIENCKKLYGDGIFDYSKVEYVNELTPVIIKCILHDVEFEQTPSSHRHMVTSCPVCKKNLYTNNHAFRQGLPEEWKDTHHILYQIKINMKDGYSFYKIGISSFGTEKRFKNLKSLSGFDSYEVIDELKTNKYNAVMCEDYILKEAEERGDRYKVHILKDWDGNGWTECFEHKIDLSYYMELLCE